MPPPHPHSITAHIPQLRHQHLNLVCNHPWYKILQKHLETFKNFYNILFHFSQIILPNYCITLSVSHKVQNFALRKTEQCSLSQLQDSIIIKKENIPRKAHHLWWIEGRGEGVTKPAWNDTFTFQRSAVQFSFIRQLR